MSYKCPICGKEFKVYIVACEHELICEGVDHVKHFNTGEKYNITLQSWKNYGEIAGECEIVSINEIPYNEIEFKGTSVKNCYEAEAGEITVILKTKTNNLKPKTFKLSLSKNSEEWANEYSNGTTEYYHFSIGKRNYQRIRSYDNTKD